MVKLCIELGRGPETRLLPVLIRAVQIRLWKIVDSIGGQIKQKLRAKKGARACKHFAGGKESSLSTLF
jgi:hypothetical protein